MSAAALSKVLGKDYAEIQLIEAADIETVGVGEATIPHIQQFNNMLGFDDNDFVRKTQGTFKLGIQFVNWRYQGHAYLHAFGDAGIDTDAVPFYHYWLKANKKNPDADIGDYSLNTIAAIRGKFMRSLNVPNSPLSNIPYAYHFDAGLYAKYLREYSTSLGANRIEAKVVKVNLHADKGFITSLTLDNGKEISGDLFIDCSGFQGLLIENALKVGFESWKHWLPCDRAWAAPCKSTQDPTPYTRSTAHKAGWQWRIPLQHRVGNGHVYCSDFISDDEALNILLNNLDGELLTEPRKLKFETGTRKQFWYKNCIAIGLASGFMEPLESTSIHLIQSSLARLVNLFPTSSFDEENIKEYNRQTHAEIEKVRDFLIAHYYINEKDNYSFWRHCKTMDIPDSLKEKINLFSCTGKIFRDGAELFNKFSWFQVMYGQGIRPLSYHPLADRTSEESLQERLIKMREILDQSANYMPKHADFIARHCAATKE